jgi:hypothetical protein
MTPRIQRIISKSWRLPGRQRPGKRAGAGYPQPRGRMAFAPMGEWRYLSATVYREERHGGSRDTNGNKLPPTTGVTLCAKAAPLCRRLWWRYAIREMKMSKMTVCMVALLLTGCSNKAVYDSIQFNNRNECNKVPPSQYEECIERASRPYEEYESEREKAIGK